MSPPGMLHVTMQPRAGLSLDQFHEWYNNEHGPTRLRLPSIFSNGLRYRATDGQQPEFLATYDVTAMSHLETETYLTLRANRSPREAETIGQVDVKRSFFDLVHTEASPLFMPIEELTDEEAEGLVTVAVDITTTDDPDAAQQYEKWLVEEHIGLLAKVPGWLRTRAFKTSTLETGQRTKYFALHDYAKENGLGGDLHKASMDTPWRTTIFDKYVAAKGRRTYSLFYVFGPAPRDLHSLANLPPAASFSSSDTKTVTEAGPEPVLTSYITTRDDSLTIPYRLEGNPSPSAPTIAFSNSLLTDLSMWDPLIALLKRNRPDVRILRYDTRGRHSIPQPPKPATLDTLAADLLALLDCLRIPRLEALVGVSMGGATTLNFALKNPSRLAKFIACDFNCTSSPANTQAWKDRTAIAEAHSGKGIAELATQTVARWFHPSSMEKPATVKWITDMVATNNVEGFKYSCTALWDYNLKPAMPGSSTPGLLVVGEGDAKGAVVKAMEGFKGLIGEKGVELRIVPNTGHLPMCEDPEAFWDAIKDFI